jgi:hypothetical protein
MAVLEVIQNISISEFKEVYQKHFGAYTEDEEAILKTTYIIWVLNNFDFTHLKVIYARGSVRSGYVKIPVPINAVHYKQDHKKRMAQKFINRSVTPA